MRRTARLHALDCGLDRIAGDRLLLGTERRVQGKPCIAHLLVQRGVLLTRVVRDRGDRDEIGLGLSQLRLQRRLDLLEACACGIVRRRALRDRAVPLLRTMLLMRNPSPLAARTTSSSPSTVISTPREAPTASIERFMIRLNSSFRGMLPASSRPARISACICAPPSISFSSLSSPSRLVDTVVADTVGCDPSTKITVLAAGDTLSANSIVKWPAVM